MLTIKQIREDLKEIRYYYSKQKVFDAACKVAGQSSVIDKVNRYNQAMSGAPARLYDLYISRYTQNCSQDTLAYDWDLSSGQIGRINKQLYEFLLKVLTEQR